jgi:hypothetical protein
MQLKSVARLLCVMTGVIAVAGVARAQECQRGCVVQGRACSGSADLAMLACKIGCRTTGKPNEVGACSHACTDTFKKAKDRCRTSLASCRGACVPVPAACRGICGQDLATCIKAVVAKQQGCIRACRTGSGRPACVSSCLTATKAGDAACAASFQACQARCSGSPSGAFVEPASSLF